MKMKNKYLNNVLCDIVDLICAHSFALVPFLHCTNFFLFVKENDWKCISDGSKRHAKFIVQKVLQTTR